MPEPKIVPRVEKIPIDKISRNPDNPRLIFRQEDMDKLLNSIKEVGIQVPITVYQKGIKFVLIDGERRWMCACKLNKQTVPAIIRPKPTHLENILLMFNIHNVREQWDLLPTALKLREVQDLLKKEGREPSISELATMTGLTLATARRCVQILELPRKYKGMLMYELAKPKAEQKLSEDFFLEMAKSLNAIKRYVPEVFDEIPREVFIDKFVEKYQTGKITNIVKFRDISRVARGSRAGVSHKRVVPVLKRLATDDNYTLEQAYEDSVASAYAERELKKKLESLRFDLSKIGKEISDDVRNELVLLRNIIDRLLEGDK